jgi:hypothetical protein
MIYKKYKTADGSDAFSVVLENGAMVSFVADPANTDYQAYLKWLEEGNTPLPAENE